MDDSLNSLRLRTHTLSHINSHVAPQDSPQLRFNLESHRQQQNSPPPGFARRRSKSQGHLLPSLSLNEHPSLLDLDLPDFSKLDLNADMASFDNFDKPLPRFTQETQTYDEKISTFDFEEPRTRSYTNSFHQGFVGLNTVAMTRDRSESDFGVLRSSPMTARQSPDMRRTPTPGSSPTQSTVKDPVSHNHIQNQNHNQNQNSMSPLAMYNQIQPPAIPQMQTSPPARRPAGSSKGDWICVQCGNTNYAWRHVCNMRKCRAPKPGHLAAPSPPGSWACLACGNLNYAERVMCNMRKCRAPRPQHPQGMAEMPLNMNMNVNVGMNMGMGMSPKNMFMQQYK